MKTTINSDGLIAAIARSLLSPAQQFHHKRGKAPKGKRWTNRSAYVPGGPYANVRGTYIKNPLIAAHIRMMHEKWVAERAVRLIGQIENKEIGAI